MKCLGFDGLLGREVAGVGFSLDPDLLCMSALELQGSIVAFIDVFLSQS